MFVCVIQFVAISVEVNQYMYIRILLVVVSIFDLHVSYFRFVHFFLLTFFFFFGVQDREHLH